MRHAAVIKDKCGCLTRQVNGATSQLHPSLSVPVEEWNHDDDGRPKTADVEIQCDRTEVILDELKTLQVDNINDASLLISLIESEGLSTV